MGNRIWRSSTQLEIGNNYNIQMYEVTSQNTVGNFIIFGLVLGKNLI